MSTSNLSFPISIKKHILQQSNCNLDVPYKKEDTYKVLIPKSKEDMTLETENHCTLTKGEVEKNVRSEAKRLRSIRLDLSSLKRGVTQKSKTDLKLEVSSDESSEEEIKKNQRKMRPLVPNYVTNSDSGPCRKPRQNRQESMILSSQNSTKVGKPQPLSIARRNARERNRVKQVNEGFATLRSRIPDYISEAYNEEKGRKSAKKLSKVETLRMAVDYIRHLETLLDLKSTGDGWVKEIKTESQPWNTPNSSVGYPSPSESKYQAPSPGPFYDQAFEYQDRIFYDYDLDFISRKDIQEKRLPALITLNRSESENQSVDDFKYYETFNRLKKETVSDENLEDESQDLENLEISEKEPDVLMLPKSKDVIEKVDGKTALPPITESFSKNITAFF